MCRPPRFAPPRKALLLLPVALIGLLIAGCEIADPELPRYSTHLVLPLGEKRIDIADIIDDEDYLIEMPDGTLGFQVEGDADSVAFDFDLATDIQSQSVTGDLGSFELNVTDPVAVDFVLVDLYPAAAALDGTTAPVPPFNFTAESAPENLEDIESATLAAGTLTVTVVNGLPVPVSALAGPDRLVLELVDPGSDAAFVTISFDPIPAGGQAQLSADLAGVTLSGAVSVRLVGGSPGSSGSPVLVDASAAIAVDAVFSDLEVTASEAVVGAQNFETSFATDLPEDYEIHSAVIESGSVSISVQNQLPIPCQATVSWPHVMDLDQIPMSVVIDLAGGASATRQADFAGYFVQAPAGDFLTQLVATVTVTSPGSGGLSVHLQADRGLRADLGDGRIVFASVTGVVPATTYDFDPMVEDVDLPDELAGVSITRATLELELVNTAGLDADTDFSLTGTSNDGDQRSIQVRETVAAADAGRATVTHIVLDETNSTIVDFLNNLPTQITLTGGVTLGGGDQVGTVRADDYAVLGWRIVSPVEVVVASSQIYGEPKDLDFEADTRNLIADHVGAAEIQLEILNHLPVGIEIRLLFGTDSLTVKTQPLLAIGPVTAAAGEVDPASHEVIVPRTSRPQISLTAAQARLLATEGLLSVLEVVLPSTDGQTVRVLTTDYVTVQGTMSLDLEVFDSGD